MEDTLNDASSSAIEVAPTRQQRAMLDIVGLYKRFGAVEVLRDVSFAVSPGEVVVVIGPSGSGKTTLLRCINLLEEYERGTITVDGEPIGYRIDGNSRRRAHVGARDRQGARADRHGVPELQPLPAYECAAEHRRSTGAGETHRAPAGRGPRLRAPRHGRAVGQGGGISNPAFGRSATEGSDRPGAGHGPQDYAVRRGHLCARPGTCRRGVGGDAAAGQ